MPSTRHCLLIVDDEPHVCDSVHDLLRREFRVLKANSAARGLPDHAGRGSAYRDVRPADAPDQRRRALDQGQVAVSACDSDAVHGICRVGVDHRRDQPRPYLSVPEKALAARGAARGCRQAAVEFDRLETVAIEREQLVAEVTQLKQRVSALETEVQRLTDLFLEQAAFHAFRSGPARIVTGNGPRRAVDRAGKKRIAGTDDSLTDMNSMGAERLVEAAGENGMEQTRHTLLIVDDEADVLDSLRHQFHRSYRVLTSVAGNEAIEILQTDDVEVILSDQRMPGMSGDQFLRQARQLKPDAIRMLFTGYADIQAVINAVNEGHIFRYILKPWDSAELEGIIRQGVEQYDLLAERRRLVTELQTANGQLVRANDELARAGQLKTAFIEVASHEFNTPITLVLGLTELLRLSNVKRPDQEHEILRQITASGRQLARLVTNMLTLLRAEDFRRTLERSPVNLVELIQKVLDQVRPFVLVRGLQIHADLNGDLGSFEIDADKISAVLINLLTNAIKFTPDGGAIELVARLSGDGDGRDPGRGPRRRPRARRHSSTCFSRSSRRSIPAAIPRATSASTSAGWASA